ncbi:MAG: hypothetical protein AAB215_05205 [Planctomycetota bacterium]
MKVCLPYSRKKRYLTGIDWVVLTLNQMTRRAGYPGNSSQIVLELAGGFSVDRFQSSIRDFCALFPLLYGRPARCWNLAPYWRAPSSTAREKPPRVEVHYLPENASRDDVMDVLTKAVNAPFLSPRDHLAFHVVFAGQAKCFLGMTFDHGLLDAGGAETFLDLFQSWQSQTGFEERYRQIAFTEPAHLCNWRRRFDAGRGVGNLMRALSHSKPCSLPLPSGSNSFRFRLIHFSSEESAAILDAAEREAGYLLLTPYLLSRFIYHLQAVFKARQALAPEHLISVSVDHRTAEAAARDVFFNHMSFLFFRVPSGIADDHDRVIHILKQQMYEQAKSRFSHNLADASMLMRILPLSVFSHLRQVVLKGNFATFGFSAIGSCSFTSPRFMDADVLNLFHMPLIPVPPGLGFIVTRYGDRLNAAIPYLDGMLTREEADGLARQVRESLVAGSGH